MINTDDEDQVEGVLLVLQRVFYDLQFSEQSVSTKKLCKSLGWDSPGFSKKHNLRELFQMVIKESYFV